MTNKPTYEELEQRILELERVISECNSGGKKDCLDFTERKHVACALHRSEERFSLAMEANKDGLWDWDINTGEVYYSPGYTAMLGYTSNEVPPHIDSWSDLIHPEDKELAFKANNDCIENRCTDFQVEFRMQEKNGGWRWILGRGKAIVRDEDGCAVRMIGTHTDITDRKRTEEALRESELKFRNIFENVQETFYEVSIEGIILDVSPSVKHLSKGQYKRQDLIGKPLFDLYADYAEREKYLEVLHKQDFVTDYEVKLKNFDCSIFDCSISSKMQRDANGRPVKIIGSLIDITDRKRAEEALEKRMIALVRPLDSPESITFDELFNLEDIQCLQDDFSEATGVASIITHTDGTPITAPSNFCRLCSEIIRNTEAGRVNCFRSDALIGRGCAEGPIIQTCLSGGLWDAGACITVGGRHIANWLIGQVRDETQTEVKMRAYAREIGADEEAVVKAFSEVPAMSRVQFEKTSRILFTLASQLSTFAYQNVQQARFISERKQVDEAIKRSEVLHRKMIDNIGDVIVIIDQNGINRYKSPNIEKLFGWKPEELVGAYSWENVHPEDLESAQRFLGSLMDEPYAVGMTECRYKCKDGSYRWIEFKGSNLLHDPDIQGLLGNYHDITERKHAEQTLSESETRFKALHNASFGGISIHDKGIILECNRGLTDISGYSTSELIGMNGLLLIAEKSRNYVMDKILFGYEKPYEAIGLRKNGEEYPIRLEARNVPYKGKIVRTVEFRDITEHKQAEEALQLTRFSIEHASDAVFWSTSDGRIVDVNEAACRSLGYTRQELLQLSVPDFDPHCQADVWTKNITELRLRGSLKFESEHLAKDGRLIPVEIVSNYVQFGDVERICDFVRDITDRKRAEEEKTKLEVQLQQAQKMEAIGTLAGGIAHDFNNILGAVLGYAELIRLGSPAGSKTFQYVSQVIKAGTRAKELVRQILAFSHQADIDKIPLQPATIIKEAVKMLRASIPTTIAIKQDIDPDAGIVMADPTQIHQIVLNLCTNAFHAMEMTGGTLTISLHKKILTREDLDIATNMQLGKFVQLSIKDTGEGIAPEILSKIFDPFFTTKEVGKGTGIGLSMVHGIVKSYGGSITCDSLLGEGTVFNITLPTVEDPSVQENEYGVPIRAGNEHILLIDDEEMLIELGQSMLERLGYQVTARRSSLDALSTFQNQPNAFDMVITDQTMPVMTGIDLARRIMQIRPEMPIILCTGYSTNVTEEKVKSMGIKGFAMKPLALKALAELIREILDEKDK